MNSMEQYDTSEHYESIVYHRCRETFA